MVPPRFATAHPAADPEAPQEPDVPAAADAGSATGTSAGPDAAPPPTAAPGMSAVPANGSVERMARLRQLVRGEGMDPEAAAREVGVDPIIAQLWLRLPDDLWPAARPSAGEDAPTSTSIEAEASRHDPWSERLGATARSLSPASGLRRVLTCRIPAPAYDRLRSGAGVSEPAGAGYLRREVSAGESPGGTSPMGPKDGAGVSSGAGAQSASGGRPGALETALQALQAGLALPLPEVAPGGWRFPRRPMALPVPAADYVAVLRLAQEHFNDDPRDAAGWLIARGLGMALPLPTADELAGLPALREIAAAQQPAPPMARFVLPPRRRPEVRAPLPADDSAPSGDELRSRREAVGISQRDLAAASGLSRGLVAEVERGRRRHVLTRLKLAETLASIAKSSGKPMAVAQ